MTSVESLPIETTPELAEDLRIFVGTLGFTPNSGRQAVATARRTPRSARRASM
jgi:hypothetical protein